MPTEPLPPTETPARPSPEEAGEAIAEEDENSTPSDRPLGAATFSEAQLAEARKVAADAREPIRPEKNGLVDQLATDSSAYAEAQVDRQAAQLLTEQMPGAEGIRQPDRLGQVIWG
jgi:hypothetical protein